jgi:hypothetical protein
MRLMKLCTEECCAQGDYEDALRYVGEQSLLYKAKLDSKGEKIRSFCHKRTGSGKPSATRRSGRRVSQEYYDLLSKLKKDSVDNGHGGGGHHNPLKDKGLKAVANKAILINRAVRRMKKDTTYARRENVIISAYKKENGKGPTKEFLDLRKQLNEVMIKFTMWIGNEGGVEDMRQIFEDMDEDNSGALDLDEFRSGLKRFGMHLEDAEVASLLKLLDTDGDGQLQFEEFKAIASAELTALNETNPRWQTQG